MSTFDEISNSEEYSDDWSQCSVVALSIAGQVPYLDARKVMLEAGRKTRRGASVDQIKKAFALAGQSLESVWVRSCTCTTIGRRLGAGRYIAFTRSHVLAIVDGVVEDWTQGRRHRVTMVYKVTNSSSEV